MCDCQRTLDRAGGAVPVDLLVAEVDQILQGLRPRPPIVHPWPRPPELEKVLVRSMRPAKSPVVGACRCASRAPVTSWLTGDLPWHVREAVEAADERLDAPTRRHFEHLFGAGFRHVRVSAGEEARKSAGAMGMAAYTVGDAIVFGEDQFLPDSPRGEWLLAHELVHVVQQSGYDSLNGRPDVPYYQRLEDQAHALSDAVASRGPRAGRAVGGLNSPPLPAPRMLQGISLGPKGRACMRFGCPPAVLDFKTSNPTGCVLADCGKPSGPSPPVVINFFCLYSCESGQGAVIFRTTVGAMCGPVYTIL